MSGKVKIDCECGGKYTTGSNEKTHRGSKKHLSYEMNKSNKDELINKLSSSEPLPELEKIPENESNYDELLSEELAKKFLQTLKDFDEKNIKLDNKTIDVLNDYMALGELQNKINNKLKDLLN